MILLRLELINFAQHRDTRVDFGPGLTMLTGAMGSGKSNMMLAGPCSLVNDWSLFPGSKSSLVSRGIGVKEHSYAASTWQLPDKTTLRVVRGFQGVKSCLEINGVRVEERLSEVDITTRIASLVGFDPDQVIKHHIVMQSDTAAIIEARDTNRIKFMAQVLGCERLLDLQDEATVEAKWAATQYSEAVIDDLRKLIRRRRALKHVNAGLDLSIAECEADILTDEQVKELQERLAKREKRVGLINERSKCSGELSRQKANLENAVAVKSKLVDYDKKAESAIEEMERNLAEVRKFSQFSFMQNELASLQATVDRHAAWIADEPVPPAEQLPENVDTKLAEMRREESHLGRHVKVLASGKTICPTCDTPLPYTGDPVQASSRLREKQIQLDDEVNRLDRLKGDWRAYQQAEDLYRLRLPIETEAMESAAKRAHALKTEIAEKFAQPPAVADPGAEAKLSAMLTKTRQAVRDAAEQLQKAQLQTGRVETFIKVLEDQMKTIVEKLEALPNLNDAAIRDAEQKLEAHNQARMTIEGYRHTRSRNDGELQAVNDAIEQRVKEVYASKQSRRWAIVTEKLAVESRPVNFPKRAMQGLLDKMAAPITAVCSHLGLPFEIKIGDSLDFIAVHRDGSEENTRCLSGGQKACVAIAFSMAKLIRCSSGLDTLFLDEPAANLDADAVAQFGTFLQALSRRLAMTGKQVVISTHHQQLKDVGQFSHTLIS